MFTKLSYNQKMVVWFFGTLLVALVLGFSIGSIPSHSSSFWPTSFALSGIAMAFTFATSGMVCERVIGKRPVRPVIHAWTHNGVTGVCADVDYQIADQERDRMLFVGANPKSPDLLARPRLMAYFTDNPRVIKDLGHFHTGSMADYEKLAEQCRVQKSEMFIHYFPRWGVDLPLNLSRLYRLVYGNNDYCIPRT